jgi:hypothetical protein
MPRTGTHFRNGELLRFISMIGMLVLVVMLMIRVRDPAVWKWLADDTGENVANASKGQLPKTAPAEQSPGAEKVHPALAITDEDPEQQDAAREEFLAITDNTTVTQPEEMPAYWRVMTWVEQQSLDALKERAAPLPAFHDLVQHPEEHRGRLVRLDLNVRRVLSYEASENPLGIARLYEIWGWTESSKAWLYVVVTPELPAGMPIGAEVYDRAAIYGYFFKMQGYLEAGAEPRAKPLSAPLLIGRVERRVSPPPPSGGTQRVWFWGLCALAVAWVGGRAAWLVWGRRKKPRTAHRRVALARELSSDDWLHNLNQALAGESFSPEEADDEAAANSRSSPGRKNGN